MKFSKILTFFIIAAVTTVYARFAQLFYLTDLKTGFFQPDLKKSALWLTVFIAAVLLISCVLSLFTRRTPNGAPAVKGALRVCTFIFAAALLADAFFFEYSSKAVVLIIITRLLAVVSALALALFATMPKIGGEMRYCLLLSSLPLFFLFKLIVVFTAYAAVSVIASNVFFLMFLCTTLAAMLLFAKLECGIMVFKNSFWFFPLAIASSLFSLLVSFPELLMLVFGKIPLANADLPSVFLGLSYAAFCISYVLALFSRENLYVRSHKTKTPPPTAEE